MTETAAGSIEIPELSPQAPAAELPGLEELAGPAPAPAPEPRRRGRPRGSRTRPRALPAGQEIGTMGPQGPQEAPAGASPEDKAAIASALALGFGIASRMAAAKRGPHWVTTDQENTMLGTAWAEALAPYMGALAKHVPWVVALTVTAGVIGPRLQQDATVDASTRRENPPFEFDLDAVRKGAPDAHPE